jgi:hypothetical protein
MYPSKNWLLGHFSLELTCAKLKEYINFVSWENATVSMIATSQRKYLWIVTGFSLKNTSEYTYRKFFKVSSMGSSQYVLNSCR